MKAKLPRGPQTSLCGPEKKVHFLCIDCSVTEREKAQVVVTIFKCRGFFSFSFSFFFRYLYYPIL